MKRGLLLAIALAPWLASCGSTTTKTVTRQVTATVAGSSRAATSTGAATSPSAATSSSATSPPGTNASGATTASSVAVTTGSAPPAAVYFQGAVGNPRKRPPTLELTADGTLSVLGVQWTSWGGPVATGTGDAEYHGCTPNCAAAPVHTALVSIRLSVIRVCGGRSYYSGVTLRMSSGRLLDESFLRRPWSPC